MEQKYQIGVGHLDTLQYEDIDPEEEIVAASMVKGSTGRAMYESALSKVSEEDHDAIMEAIESEPTANPRMVEAHKQASEMFVKLDDGKPELKYILDTPLASAEKCRVRKFGDEKYDRFNWYKCDDPERYLSAALRHLHAIAEDPNAIDEESGLPHRAHALCSLEFYNELVARKQKGIN